MAIYPTFISILTLSLMVLMDRNRVYYGCVGCWLVCCHLIKNSSLASFAFNLNTSLIYPSLAVYTLHLWTYQQFSWPEVIAQSSIISLGGLSVVYSFVNGLVIGLCRRGQMAEVGGILAMNALEGWKRELVSGWLKPEAGRV